MSSNYTFAWLGKNKESDGIPCTVAHQCGPPLSPLCITFFCPDYDLCWLVKSVQATYVVHLHLFTLVKTI